MRRALVEHYRRGKGPDVVLVAHALVNGAVDGPEHNLAADLRARLAKLRINSYMTRVAK
jgi:hypothetical protein